MTRHARLAALPLLVFLSACPDDTEETVPPDAGEPAGADAGLGAPERMASGQAKPHSILIQGDAVYWTNFENGTVMGQWIAGGEPWVQMSGQSEPSVLATDGVDLFWANGSGVNKCRLGTPTDLVTLATGQSSPIGLAVDNAHVYWANFGNSTIYRVEKAGGTPQKLAENQDNPFGLAMDSQYIYWGQGSGGYLRKLRLADSRVEDELIGQAQVLKLVAEPFELYFNRLGGEVVVHVHSTNEVKVLASDQRDIGTLAVDAQYLYWTRLSEGTVSRISRDGAPMPTILASGQNRPSGIAVNASYIYWVNEGDGTVWRIKK